MARATGIEDARRELERGDWAAAQAAAQRAVDEVGTAEAYELLGLALWWLSDIERLFSARERAYRLYVDAGEHRRAARVAVWIDWDYRSFRAQPAVASGWLRRARRLLQDDQDCAEYGWLRMREGDALYGHDAAPAVAACAEAAELGRRHGDVDLEFIALSTEGLARVAAGQVREGMGQLDEATVAVVAGEFRDPSAAGVTCCHMISACELVRDYERAEQWCLRVREYCRSWNFPPLFAVCRTQYAGVLVSNGRWEDAEAELGAAIIELGDMRPGYASMGHLGLAELRHRQGRLEEATALLAPFEALPQAWLALAAIALDRGDLAEAERYARRFLRRVSRGNHTGRATALEQIVLAAAAGGRLATVRREIAELRALVAEVDSDAIRAGAMLVDGMVFAAEGATADAADALEESASRFERAGLSYDTVRARLLLVETLLASGDRDGRAGAEARGAREQARQLGAARLASRADALLESLATAVPAESPALPDRTSGTDRGTSTTVVPLTPRERQVLAQVAKGRSNRQIAERLGVSQHTVHRHLANVLMKTGTPTRAAAVAYALRNSIGMDDASMGRMT